MLIALIAISVFGAIMCIAYAMFGRARATSMETRIQDFRTRAVSLEDNEVDLELPFAERVLRPRVEGVSRAISSVLPASVLADFQKQLVMAGNTMTLQSYVTFWAVIFSLFTGLGLLMFVALPGNLLLQKAIFVVMFAGIGWIFPRMRRKGKGQSRCDGPHHYVRRGRPRPGRRARPRSGEEQWSAGGRPLSNAARRGNGQAAPGGDDRTR